MADDIEAAGPISKRSRKRKRPTPIQKLPTDQKVEVRSIEEGFEGSWHSANVIDIKNQIRVVKYHHILCDDRSDNLVDSIPVLFHNNRCRIRPVPPRFKHNINCLHYGQCVDVFHQDAWWEGVIFDHDDMCHERLVFFPDVGDELRVSIKKIRLTRDWYADTDEWKFRGNWGFLEILEDLEVDFPILVSVKQIWYEIRMKKCFRKKIKEWTTGQMREIWEEMVKEVILDNLKLGMVEFFSKLQREGYEKLGINKQFLDSIVNIKPNFFENLEVLPSDPNILPIKDELDLDDDDDDMGPPGYSKNDVFDPDFKDQSFYNWTKVQEIGISEPDLAVEPVCCPESISQYYESTLSNTKPTPSLILKVRQHLLYLGWEIELKKDFFGANRRRGNRYRYIDPNNKKQYFSLNNLCKDLCSRSSDYTSLVSYKPPTTRGLTVVEVEPEYCPQAMVDYYKLTSEENHDLRKKDADFKDLLLNRVKKQLSFIGWKFGFVDDLRKRAVYTSPNGKNFYSLSKACGYQISGKSNIQEKEKEKGVGKLIIKKKNGVLSIEAAAARAKGSFSKSITEEKTEKSRKTCVLRSSKRAREEISPLHQASRTVLSWLIDNHVIIPRSKVEYRCRKDGHTMKEGKVTRDGIKCNCCQTVFSVSRFESHAGSSYKRPSANIFLEDGRSLLQCQIKLKSELNSKLSKTEPRRLKGNRQKLVNDNDYICSVCHYGGELVLCDQCPSSFHTRCLGLKEVPDGDWFCPSCCCRICNQNKFSDDCEEDTDINILNCEQCERRYHIGCLKRKEGFSKVENFPQVNWFCSMRCEEIFLGINKILGEPIPVGRDDLTWTVLKHKTPPEIENSNDEEMTENYSKLNIAISVMHECFEPVKEPRTQRDIVEDVIFSRWSELNRLNFKGFYTILLEKDDELVSAATIRIYGEKVAELPLIGTRFRYRRLGMCHALMNVLEKKLVELGVERLVLPAVPSVLRTWTSSFGFSVMTEAQKLEFLGYTFLDFQGTQMCQKSLVKSQTSAESSISRGINYEAINESNVIDLDGVSEVSQAERIEESGMIDQHSLECIDRDDKSNNGSGSGVVDIMEKQQEACHVDCGSEISVECSMEASNKEDDDNNGSNNGGHLKCYQRRKVVAC